MLYSHILKNSRYIKKWRLFFSISLFLVFFYPVSAFAHQAPYSIAYLDVSPNRVGLELQIPLTELELAYGSNLTQNPQTLLARMGPQLKEYILAHTHAYTQRERPWLVEITGMTMDKEQQIESGPPFWELRVHLLLLPQHNENTRRFMFDYDAVVHQVVNHIIFVAIRSDWETGRADSLTADSDPMTIRIASDSKVHPLEINIAKGSNWTGFKNMFSLGMQHIKEGTDHLLFLIVLLLPSMLLLSRKYWGRYGGLRYSFSRLVKIVTAFTIGHSVTLLIGATGLLQLPQQPVEILIAFSILISAIHAVYPIFPGKEMYVAAGFGLVHGLAFATILSNFNLTAGTLALSVLGFNLGIETMQLFIVTLIFPWLMLLNKTPYYKWFRIPAAILAAVAALAWIAERTSGKSNIITAYTAAIPENSWNCILGIALVALLVFAFYRVRLLKTQRI
ncbi:MAG: HupE/UreJ family protein [Niabella sp.]